MENTAAAPARVTDHADMEAAMTDPMRPVVCINSRASEERAAYVTLLQAHDFEHEFSDEGYYRRKGRDERAALDMMRRALDADCAIWNEYAPDGHKLRDDATSAIA